MDFTVISCVCPANCRNRTATGYQELVRITDVILGFWSGQHKLVKVQSELTNIRIHLIDSQLTASSSLVVVRMLWADKVRPVLTHDIPTGGHDCSTGLGCKVYVVSFQTHKL